MPVVEKIDAAIDKIEDQVFDRPTPRTLEQLVRAKTRFVSYEADPAPSTRGVEQTRPG
jgi:Mg2+ and Co2+ transporter CorA